MQLGRRIKELRKKRNITQQDLAEMLGVSYQAISRWENNITSPDITALPVLANIFNVTVDYLLDVNINENTQIIENIYKQSWELCVNQKHKEAQELLEEKTKLFPNNYFLKNELLNIYYVLMYDNDKEIYQDKIIDLANEIINNCLISDYKFSAIKALILIYGSKNEFTKGKELLELLPDSSYSKDHLKEYTLTGDEKEIAIQEQTDNILSSFEHIIYKTMFKKSVGERSSYLQKYIQLLDLIYDDKDYGIYNYNLYLIYLNCAKDYADIKDSSETLKYIDLAKRHLDLLLKLKEESKLIRYSSFMVNKLCDNPKDWPFEKESMLGELKKELENNMFDFVRKDICLIIN